MCEANLTRWENLNAILSWCKSVVGPCAIVTKDARFHNRSSVFRLQAQEKSFYLKIHQLASFWEAEVHGYEQWAAAFVNFAPRLIAVHEQEPMAILCSEIPGSKMVDMQLNPRQEMEAWRSAGQALLGLHEYARGAFFGPCRRDGSSSNEPVFDPVSYLAGEFKRLCESGWRAGLLSERESTIILAVQGRLDVFENERPVPCHRDYGPDNWLVTPNGTWSGLLDFEFSHWDVRVTDFSRYPNWEWIHRPELLEAFFEGYGRKLNFREQEQCLVSRTLYALGAVVWGNENAFYGFEAEGREALEFIGNLLG